MSCLLQRLAALVLPAFGEEELHREEACRYRRKGLHQTASLPATAASYQKEKKGNT